MNDTDNTKHTFAFFIFIDPLYKDGWVSRKELPVKRDSIHIGCGVVIKEDKDFITLALAEEMFDTTSQVMNPFTIHKELLIKLYTFDEELFYEQTRGKKIERRICKEIDFEIGDYV